MSHVAASPTVLSVAQADLSAVWAEEPSASPPTLSPPAPPGPALPGPTEPTLSERTLSERTLSERTLSGAEAEPRGDGGIGIQVLGPVEAQVAGAPVPVTGARQLSVLAALALGAGRVVSIGHLARAVWDGMPPRTARAQIQGSIAQLRRCLPGLIRTEGKGYLLAAASRQVDAAVFRRLSGQACAAAQDHRPAEAAALFRSALGLWRGDALDGVTGLGADAAHLEEQRTAAVQGLFAAELGAGRHARVLPDLYGHVVRLPWQEPLRGLLMLALYRCGREAEALTAYADGCHQLAEHLGAEPGTALRQLAQAIRAHDPHLDAPFLLVPAALAGIQLR